MQFKFNILPAPKLSATLFAVWLLLNQQMSLGHIVLAVILAILVPLFTERMAPERCRIAQPWIIIKLAGVVLFDIVKSNIDVAKRILGSESRIQPRFVWLPLSIRDPRGIVTLMGLITMTPGTLSADLTADRRYLLLHVFHIDEDAADGEAANREVELVASIKARYEAPLLEIFEKC